MDTKQQSLKKSTQNISNSPTHSITENDRRHMIAEAAYYHAEHRGFQGGDINQDWLLAEAEIDSMLMEKKPH